MDSIEYKLDLCSYYLRTTVQLRVDERTRIPSVASSKLHGAFYVPSEHISALESLVTPLKTRSAEWLKDRSDPGKTDFTYPQRKAAEMMAHRVRSSAYAEPDEDTRRRLFKEASDLYAGAMLASPVISARQLMLSLLKKPEKYRRFTPVFDNLNVLTEEDRRHYAHSFAGFALSVAFTEEGVSFSQFVSASSAAISWMSTDCVELAHTLRLLFLLYGRHRLGIQRFTTDSKSMGSLVGCKDLAAFLEVSSKPFNEFPGVFYQLTRAVVIPMMLRKGHAPMVMEHERLFFNSEDWESALLEAEAVNTRAEKRERGLIFGPARRVATVRFSAQGIPIERQCGHCNAPETRDRRMYHCVACHQAYYCSRDCQKADWCKHSPLCRPK